MHPTPFMLDVGDLLTHPGETRSIEFSAAIEAEGEQAHLTGPVTVGGRLEGDAMVGVVARADRISNDERAKTLGEQIEHGLLHADVRFNAAHNDLIPSLLRPAVNRSATDGRREIKFLFRRREEIAQRRNQLAETFGVLNRGGCGNA